MGLSCFFLGLTWKRYRHLPKGEHFCDVYVPEPNMTLLRVVGHLLMVITAVGAFLEGLAGAMYASGFFLQLAHMGLYFSFFFVGAVSLLESRQALPPDACRMALCLASFLQYLLWNEHGLMKTDMADKRVHLLQAQVNVTTTLLITAYPRLLVA